MLQGRVNGGADQRWWRRRICLDNLGHGPNAQIVAQGSFEGLIGDRGKSGRVSEQKSVELVWHLGALRRGGALFLGETAAQGSLQILGEAGGAVVLATLTLSAPPEGEHHRLAGAAVRAGLEEAQRQMLMFIFVELEHGPACDAGPRVPPEPTCLR